MAARKTSEQSAARVDVEDALAWLAAHGTKATRDGMARYGIPSTHAYGVTVGATKAYAKQVGKDHALALALWASGRYEARLLASFVGEPAALTSKQMDAWASDFDNWAVCDTVCFHLFDRTPLAWARVKAWAGASAEYKKRAAFALLWGLTVHDKLAPDEQFVDCLPLIERAARDERDHVKKAVDMALRALGKRNPALKKRALALAATLSEADDASSAWIGRSTLRELNKR
jgi:3-methyladenine DNA glycosylase AlkD